MCTVVDPLRFDAIETRICEEAGFNKSLIPYVSCLDIIGIKIVDLSKNFDKEHAKLASLAQAVCRNFFEIQRFVEFTSAFCSKDSLTPSKASKSLASLKEIRTSITALKKSEFITCIKTCDIISKLYFLVESRIKKTPYSHLLRPLDCKPLDYDLIDEKSMARFMVHLQHYHQEMSRMNESSCKIVDEFLSDPIFFDPAPIKSKLVTFEDIFKSFLWRSKLHQKELLSSSAIIPARDFDKVVETCRYLHIFNHKVMAVAASIERMRKIDSGLDLSFNRMSVQTTYLKICRESLHILEKSYRQASIKFDQIRLNPRYPKFTAELQRVFENSFKDINGVIQHEDDLLLNYVKEKCEQFSEEVSDLELYFEGDFFDQEVKGASFRSWSESLAEAFLKAHEQCLSSHASDGTAQKLKLDLEELLPFLRAYVCSSVIFKQLLSHIIQDRVYPKKELDQEDLMAKIKQESDRFLVLPIKYGSTSLEGMLWDSYLKDPYIRQTFAHVLAF